MQDTAGRRTSLRSAQRHVRSRGNRYRSSVTTFSLDESAQVCTRVFTFVSTDGLDHAKAAHDQTHEKSRLPEQLNLYDFLVRPFVEHEVTIAGDAPGCKAKSYR